MPTRIPVYVALSRMVAARANCRERMHRNPKDDNAAMWFSEWRNRAEMLCHDMLPRGSGFDQGTTIEMDRSSPDRIILDTAFHHMNENGMYTHWTFHEVIITPSLGHGFSIEILPKCSDGRDSVTEEGWNDFAIELMSSCLNDLVDG
jgi:hypothetical protein